MSCFYLGETLRNSAVSRAFGISRLCGKPLSPRRRVKSTPETVPFVSHASPICTVCVFAVSDEVLSVFVISSPTPLCGRGEKEIYLRLCDKYGLKPSECLFTDDRMVNVLGAKATGMEAVLFTTTKKYIFEIERIFGIKIEQ